MNGENKVIVTEDLLKNQSLLKQSQVRLEENNVIQKYKVFLVTSKRVVDISV